MTLRFRDATAKDIAAIAGMLNATSGALTTLYLTGMAVSVAHQRRGLGRAALDDARGVAAAWPADAIRLDAYDAPAGAGEFYERCGYEARARVAYRDVPLIYYELVLR